MTKNLRPLSIIAFLLLSVFTRLEAQVNLSELNSSYVENFNNLLAAGTTNDSTTVPAGWTFRETGSNANLTYAAGTGSSTTGNTYSLGLDSDRAFGGLQSGSLTPIIGVQFINNTGATITELQIQYSGEQWRLGATARAQADRLDFQISLNASSLVSGTWTDHDSFDFSAPILSGTVGTLNGNAVENRTTLQGIITGLSIPEGATFWIRWTDFNVASSDDALAIDDFSITPIGIPSDQPAIVLTPTSLNFGEININTSKVLSYTVSGSNLSDSAFLINTLSSHFTLSLDQIDYNDSLMVAGMDTVYIKFSPDTNGVISDSIFHYSSGIWKRLYITGSGFDPLQNISTIAAARSKSAGTKVVVAGRVTVANQHGSPSFVQDATGGIPVFDYNFSNGVAIGDSVMITGSIGFFNDQVQIGGNISFSLVDSVKKIIEPKLIALGDMAANEGLLVTVQNVEVVNRSFVFYPQSTEVMTDGSIQADLRIDGDTNIPGLTKPQESVDITGVVGRFKTSAQLLPRFREDLPGVNEPQTPFDSIPNTHTFDVMNWNLEFFGATREVYPEEFGPADEALQLQNVTKVIQSIHADVIAVQEVSDDILFGQLIDSLPGYKGICSDRYSYSFQGPSNTFPPQKVCFIYDSATVQIESARVLFENRYDSARSIDASLIPNYPTGDASSFWSSGRLPFMLTAFVTVEGVTEKIRFINIHAKSGATQSDYNRRVYDAKVLKDTLDAQYAGDQIVLLGDFNDDLNQSITTNLPTSYTDFVQDTLRYNSITQSLSLAGAKSIIGFDNVIDNQIISGELYEEYLIGSEQVITPFMLIANYASTTSDHLPVVSRFKFVPDAAPTISFIETEVSREEGSGSYAVRLKLSSAQANNHTITIKAVGGPGAYYGSFLDYTTSPTPQQAKLTLNIPAGTDEVQFSVIPNLDLLSEDDETITFFITSISEGIAKGAISTTTFTILDTPLCLPVFTVFPNPTFGVVNIYTLPANEGNILQGTLIDSQGQIIGSGEGTTAQLSEQFTNALQGKRRGVYVLKLKACDAVITIRILKL